MESNQPKKENTQLDRTRREQAYIENFINSYFERYYIKCLQQENANNDPENENNQNQEDEDPETAISQSILRPFHSQYLIRNLKSTGPVGKVFDNGQPWMIYWLIHSLDVLDYPHDYLNNEKLISNCVSFLSQCQSPDGGFMGGPYQLPNILPTYAAILSMITLGSEEGYKMINREKMYEFLMSRRNPAIKGSFLVHDKGECDMRGAYTAMIIADVLNIMTDELKDGVGDYIASLQSYEGGLGATTHEEAHGGYTFCGFAGLCLIGEAHKVDLHKLTWWACSRQLSSEGGFNGRTNKVVDACYTFWVGALFHLINIATGNQVTNHGKLLCDQLKVQMYTLLCCQDHEEGGMRDKPGKYSDYYHTCYALSGLSAMQDLVGSDEKVYFRDLKENKLQHIDPIYNVEKSKLEKARKYFHSLPKINTGNAK